MLQQNKEDYAVVALDSVSRVQTPVSCSIAIIPFPFPAEKRTFLSVMDGFAFAD